MYQSELRRLVTAMMLRLENVVEGKGKGKGRGREREFVLKRIGVELGVFDGCLCLSLSLSLSLSLRVYACVCACVRVRFRVRAAQQQGMTAGFDGCRPS